MITTISLINLFIILHSYLCVCAHVGIVWMFKFYSFRKFKIFNTVWTIVITLYIRAPETIHIKTECSYPLTSIYFSHSSAPCYQHSILCFYTLDFFFFFPFLDSTYEWDHIELRLVKFTSCIIDLCMLLQKAGFFFFILLT